MACLFRNVRLITNQLHRQYPNGFPSLLRYMHTGVGRIGDGGNKRVGGVLPTSDLARGLDAKGSPKSEDEEKEDNSYDESLIQPEWVALERKLARRKPKRKGSAPEGRSAVRESAWDAEHV